MTKLFENGCITPHGKAAIVADLLARASVFSEPVSFSLLHHHVMQQFGVPEEEIGGSIVDATFLLARAGLLRLAPQADTIGQGTTVQASSGLVSYMWGEDPIDLTA